MPNINRRTFVAGAACSLPVAAVATTSKANEIAAGAQNHLGQTLVADPIIAKVEDYRRALKRARDCMDVEFNTPGRFGGTFSKLVELSAKGRKGWRICWSHTEIDAFCDEAGAAIEPDYRKSAHKSFDMICRNADERRQEYPEAWRAAKATKLAWDVEQALKSELSEMVPISSEGTRALLELVSQMLPGTTDAEACQQMLTSAWIGLRQIELSEVQPTD